MKVYLDNAATTKVDDDIAEMYIDYCKDNYGNPSSIHSFGTKAKWEIDEAILSIAEHLGCDEREIFFTSGATESNNWALKRAFDIYNEKGNHIITTKIEHDSILNVCKYLERERGARITYIDVDENGIVNVEDIKKAIMPETIIISVMFVNNEIGTIQPISEISKIAKEKNIFFHCDGVQALNKLDISLDKLNVDTMSFSGHKIHAPKGIGILYINKNIKFKAYLHGGAQQHRRRSGTENVYGIVAMSKAIEKFNIDEVKEIEEKRNYLIDKILQGIEGTKLNGDYKNRVCNNINISFENCDAEEVILGLDMYGIAVSGGSACESGAVDPSHVLLALNIPYSEVRSSIRITLSKYTTYDELDYTYSKLEEVVKKIRQVII